MASAKQPSKADRLAVAQTHIESAKSIIADVKSECEEWLERMPNMAEPLDDTITALDEAESSLDSIDLSDCAFSK